MNPSVFSSTFASLIRAALNWLVGVIGYKAASGQIDQVTGFFVSAVGAAVLLAWSHLENTGWFGKVLKAANSGAGTTTAPTSSSRVGPTSSAMLFIGVGMLCAAAVHQTGCASIQNALGVTPATTPATPAQQERINYLNAEAAYNAVANVMLTQSKAGKVDDATWKTFTDTAAIASGLLSLWHDALSKGTTFTGVDALLAAIDRLKAIGGATPTVLPPTQPAVQPPPTTPASPTPTPTPTTSTPAKPTALLLPRGV